MTFKNQEAVIGEGSNQDPVLTIVHFRNCVILQNVRIRQLIRLVLDKENDIRSLHASTFRKAKTDPPFSSSRHGHVQAILLDAPVSTLR